MNGAHLHLLVNHIPLFTIVFGFFALAWAAIKGSNEFRCAAILLFIVAGISAWVSSETGDQAEEVVKLLPEISKTLIHNHEEAADFACISAYLSSALAIALAFASRYKPNWIRAVQIVLLLLALLSSTIMVRTAYLGGLIRHSELRSEK